MQNLESGRRKGGSKEFMDYLTWVKHEMGRALFNRRPNGNDKTLWHFFTICNQRLFNICPHLQRICTCRATPLELSRKLNLAQILERTSCVPDNVTSISQNMDFSESPLHKQDPPLPGVKWNAYETKALF